ncbi:MAG: DarT ssDNA thymidine ADP-ribosyltransferase family protein [Candidatus Hydrogenedens sp.]
MTRYKSHKKCAEVMVPEKVPTDYFIGIVVFCKSALDKLIELCPYTCRNKLEKMVTNKPSHFLF